MGARTLLSVLAAFAFALACAQKPATVPEPLTPAAVPAVRAQRKVTFSATAAASPHLQGGGKFDNALVTRCIGSSHAATALRASWQNQLSDVVRELGTQHVRFHGLLDDDMSVVIKDSGVATAATTADDHAEPSSADHHHGRHRHHHHHHDHHIINLHHEGSEEDGGAGNDDDTCTFVADTDYLDPGGAVIPAATKEDCCRACYTTPTGLPEPCVVAVWTPSGQCYQKLNSGQPVSKVRRGLSLSLLLLLLLLLSVPSSLFALLCLP